MTCRRSPLAHRFALAALALAGCSAVPARAQSAAPAATPASAPASASAPGPAHASAPTPALVPAPAAAADATLYRDLGGEAGIAALMRDLVVRVKADARLAPFFENTNMPELTRQLADQVCAIAGGPCEYRGAPMKAVHAQFEIRRADFNALVEVLQQSMEARGIAFGTQNRLLARLAPMHRDIVNSR
ncbi:MAG: group 1 truncated hemoglobin [Burkholderiales bacterium]|nr:group 1 truncated hemoglobin [Burkholderiales bacterium]